MGARGEAEVVSALCLTGLDQRQALARVELDAVNPDIREPAHQRVQRRVVTRQHCLQVSRGELHRHLGCAEQRGHGRGVCRVVQERRAHHRHMRAGVEAVVCVRQAQHLTRIDLQVVHARLAELRHQRVKRGITARDHRCHILVAELDRQVFMRARQVDRQRVAARQAAITGRDREGVRGVGRQRVDRHYVGRVNVRTRGRRDHQRAVCPRQGGRAARERAAVYPVSQRGAFGVRRRQQASLHRESVKPSVVD